MAKNKVITSFQKVKLANDNAKKAKADYGLARMKKSDLSPLTTYLLENEKSGKTDDELRAEFREDCSHSFQVIAAREQGGTKEIVYSCKWCYLTEATRGAKKPGMKKKVKDDGEKDSD